MSKTDIVLNIEGVSHRFGTNPVLNCIRLKVPRGQVVALLGPSGCGKSTLLRAILGSHPAQDGYVYVDNELVEKPSRQTGIVYQDCSLFRHLTAVGNVAYGPMLDQTSLWYRMLNKPRDGFIKCARKFNVLNSYPTFAEPYYEEAKKMLDQVRMSHAYDKYPKQMSGGMQQRTAIAQALMNKPSILLMDEPFSKLDEDTREELHSVIDDFVSENRKAIENREKPPYTIIFVTQEIMEAIRLADRIIGISQFHPDGKNGAIVCYDKATVVYDTKNPNLYDYPAAISMKNEIREAVMNPKNKADKSEFLTFWKDVRNGESDVLRQL